jgi:hypothetical protein
MPTHDHLEDVQTTPQELCRPLGRFHFLRLLCLGFLLLDGGLPSGLVLDLDELADSEIVENLVLEVLADDTGSLRQQDVLDHVLPELPHAVLVDAKGSQEEEKDVLEVVLVVGDAARDEVLGDGEDALLDHHDAQLDQEAQEVGVRGVRHLLVRVLLVRQEHL